MIETYEFVFFVYETRCFEFAQQAHAYFYFNRAKEKEFYLHLH